MNRRKPSKSSTIIKTQKTRFNYTSNNELSLLQSGGGEENFKNVPHLNILERNTYEYEKKKSPE